MTLCRVTLTPALTLVAALAFAACGSSAPATPAAGSSSAAGAAAKVAVVASTDVYGSVVSAVGGEAVQVTSIIDKPGVDPHEYESTPSDAAAVNKAALVVYNGAGYDPFAEKLIATASTEPTTIDVADLSGLRAQVPADRQFNEHVWYSLPTIKKLADTVATDLGKADAASAPAFTANAAAFDTKVDALAAQLDAIKAEHNGEKVAITEPVPLYLIEAAGLVNATPAEFSEAVEEGSDAPAAVVADTLALFQGPDEVKVLLANTQTEDAASRQVAEAATAGNVPIVQVTETLPPGEPDYVAWMRQQIDALGTALDRAV
jgi:zinc/manganese transport system substrate-binding protein